LNKIGESEQMVANNQDDKLVEYFNNSFYKINMWIDIDDKDNVKTGEQRIELDLNRWVVYQCAWNHDKQNSSYQEDWLVEDGELASS